MRLFAAVLPPATAADELEAALTPLHALPGADALRWTERAGWHLTLAFYGEVADDLLDDLHERLGRTARRGHPLRLGLAGAGRFGDRALYAGVDGDGTDLRHLARTAAAAGRRSGVDQEEAAHFRPHLTLARTRRSASVDLRPYVAALGGFAGTPWTAGELALVRSNLPVSGVPGEQPRYETERAWPLGR